MKSYDTLEEIVLNMRNNKGKFSTQLIINDMLDPLFWISQKIISDNLVILNQTRNLMREKKMIEGKNQYQVFQKNWKSFTKAVEALKVEAEEIEYSKKLLKVITTLETLIINSTQAPVMSIKPSPPIDFLRVEATEVGVDWIINKIKSYLNKFAQVYTSTRIYYLLSNTLN